MKTRTGYVQGYNGQVLVSELQVIVAADLTQEENDCRQLRQIGALAADAGYWSEANCARSDPDGPELFVATTFGQVKVVSGCDRFMRWGHSACRSEWRLIWATHNLLKTSCGGIFW
ncbi:MAG: hypothetical protein AB1331_01945 [Bacillota bacterium]